MNDNIDDKKGRKPQYEIPAISEQETIKRLVGKHQAGKGLRDRNGVAVAWVSFDGLLAAGCRHWNMTPNQRNVRLPNVAMLVAAHRDGTFLPCNPIWVCSYPDDTGAPRFIIVNGQHTLLSIEESKVTRELPVYLDACSSFAEAAARYAVLDRGAKRTQADINKMLKSGVTGLSELEALKVLGSDLIKATGARSMIFTSLTSNTTHGDDETLTPDAKFESVIQEPWRTPMMTFFQAVGSRNDEKLPTDDAFLWRKFHSTFTGASYLAVFAVSLRYRPTETVEVIRKLVTYAKNKRRRADAAIKTLYTLVVDHDQKELGGARGFVLFRTAHALNAAIRRRDEEAEMMTLVKVAKERKDNGGPADLFRTTWGLATGGEALPDRNRLDIDGRDILLRSRHKGYGHPEYQENQADPIADPIPAGVRASPHKKAA